MPLMLWWGLGIHHQSPESTSTRLLVLCLTSTVHAQSHRHLIGIWLLSAVVIANSLLHCLSYPTPFPAYLGSVLLVPGISHASGISLTFCFLLPCPETGSTTKPARIFTCHRHFLTWDCLPKTHCSDTSPPLTWTGSSSRLSRLPTPTTPSFQPPGHSLARPFLLTKYLAAGRPYFDST